MGRAARLAYVGKRLAEGLVPAEIRASGAVELDLEAPPRKPRNRVGKKATCRR
jgi:hypothetical protein